MYAAHGEAAEAGVRVGVSQGDVARQVCEAAHEAEDAGVFAARVVTLLCRLALADRAALVEVDGLEGLDGMDEPPLATDGGTAMLHLAWRGQPIATLHLERAAGSFGEGDLARVRAALPLVEIAWAALRATTPSRAPAISATELGDLTPRQREIAELVARGLTTPEIAELLGSSPNTVRNQLSALFRRTHTSTRAELAALVARAVHLSY